MTFKATKIIPEEVFLTTLTPDESKKNCSLTNRYAKYKPTGNEFMDALTETVSTYLMRDSGFYAKLMGTSSRVLTNMVRLYTGMPFVQWRNAYVLLAASELLCDTDYTLKTIGMRLGFSGNKTFGRWFTKETDETPALWRIRRKNRKKRQEREQLQELKALLHSGQLYKENGVWKLNNG